MDSMASAITGAFIAAVAAFLVARFTLKRDIQRRDYAHLDAMYVDILKEYLAHPQFQDVARMKDFQNAFKDEALRYDAFAMLVHNFLESIFDLSVTDDVIDPYWAAIFDHHAKLHLKWLLAGNRPFERAYYDFVRVRYAALV